ncbi:fimbrillin family protein [Bacteroides finegoldii]|uniref:fimbrillin family protein n=1 Tax=Bacteroides finegoldii TaxID=338188 RepID=UPI00189D46B4|nr:fimbrillin family protein [Bacteroides finegoldii]
MRRKFLLLFAIPLLLTSCDNDDTGGIGKLEEVTFTAGFIPITRLTTNDNWGGLTDRTVAIEIDGIVKQYIVDEHGRLTSHDPFFWNGKTELTVNAWYPYNAGVMSKEIMVKADQSGSGYWESDHLEVISGNVSRDNSLLSFNHRTTSLKCDLDVILDNVVYKDVNVKFLNIKGVEGGTTIQAFGGCRALVVPQTISAGTDFLEVTLKDESLFIYTLEKDLFLSQGHTCHMYVKISEDGFFVLFTDSPVWHGSADDIDGTVGDLMSATNNPSWNGDSDSTEGTANYIESATNTENIFWEGSEENIGGVKNENNGVLMNKK